ncbi:hypothetical protein AB595_12955 [Massilia sp. WF1]|uniref:hypothetical protein n=1 Tax=unclassified Massilia TaxID=2609279 RepID=UPI00064A4D0F|nr:MULTISPECIES: hypothetical protein [unclassified Massilia]ALK97473.1 hypothetical protein AM586_15825 [Massilia sp. WG5]KLU36655.1 hypothetical protein AB595_12955 [Massilia sp. WF1]
MKNAALLGFLLLAGLTACGGSDHDDHGQPPPASPPPVAEGAPDPFTAQVASLSASAPDDTEPVALDGAAPTMPDNTEPQPVGP